MPTGAASGGSSSRISKRSLASTLRRGSSSSSNSGRSRERAGQRRALLLAVRELARRVGEHLVDLQELGDTLDAFAVICAAGACCRAASGLAMLSKADMCGKSAKFWNGHADAAVIRARRPSCPRRRRRSRRDPGRTCPRSAAAGRSCRCRRGRR